VDDAPRYDKLNRVDTCSADGFPPDARVPRIAAGPSRLSSTNCSRIMPEAGKVRVGVGVVAAHHQTHFRLFFLFSSIRTSRSGVLSFAALASFSSNW